MLEGRAAGPDHSLLLLGHRRSLAQTQLVPVPMGAQHRLHFLSARNSPKLCTSGHPWAAPAAAGILTSGWIHHCLYNCPPTPAPETCSPSNIYFLLREGRSYSVFKHTWLPPPLQIEKTSWPSHQEGEATQGKRLCGLCFRFCSPHLPRALSRD